MAEEGPLPPAATSPHSEALTLAPPPTMGGRGRSRAAGRVRDCAPAATKERLGRRLKSAADERPLRIALLAPPWRPVAATGDGTVEGAVALLADALVAAGHDVTVYAAPGSRSRARVVSVLDRVYEQQVGASMVEADHTARAFAAVERAGPAGTPFDVVHDHSGWTALAMADRLPVPMLHTVHGPFDEDARAWYRAHGAKAAIVCRSLAHAAERPAGLRVEAVVPNPVEPVVATKEEILLWGGPAAPGTGLDEAIRVAQAAGLGLVVAGAGDATGVQRVERLDGELLARSRALLMPATWAEPSGSIMVEAMAAGTPVIAPPRGSAPEVVEDGVTGVLADAGDLAAAVDRALAIDLDQCRARAALRFGPSAAAALYADVYRSVARLLPVPVLNAPRVHSAGCRRPAPARRPRSCARR